MNTKFQLRVQRYGWDAAAEVYDELWRKNLLPVHQVIFEIAQLKSAERVFEMACGSGFATHEAASLIGATGHILATDISAEMIAILQNQSATMGLENIRAERVAAEDLDDLADGSFNAALCSLGLMFMPDPEVGLKTMWQALKPGGRAIAAVWGQRSKCAWADIFPIVDRTVKSEVCPLFFSLGAGTSLALGFENQGFVSVDTRRIETSLDFDNQESLLGAMIDGGAVALAAKRFDTDTRHQVESEFLKTVEEYRKGESYSIPVEFVVVAGEKPE